MTVKDRLIKFLKYKRIGQNRFADMVGVSSGFVNNIRTSIQPKTLLKISEHFPDLNTGWLLTGNGSMLNEEEVDPIISNDVISMPREVFEQLSKLTESVLSQQRVIESQNSMLETLINTNKKIVAQMENNATSAGAKEVSVA